MSPRINLSKLLDCPEDGIVRHEGYKQFTYGVGCYGEDIQKLLDKFLCDL
jgi:hypothetical protein